MSLVLLLKANTLYAQAMNILEFVIDDLIDDDDDDDEAQHQEAGQE